MDRKALIKALTEAAKINDAKNAYPRLMRGALLWLDGHFAHLFATNCDRTLGAWFDLGPDDSAPAVHFINARDAIKVCKALDGESVHADGILPMIERYNYSGEDAYFAAAAYSPMLQALALDRTAYEADPLRTLMAKTSYAMSKDETRGHLCGAYLESQGDGMVRMVATDGHRLARNDAQWSDFPALATKQSAAEKATAGVIIPRAGILAMQRQLGGKRTATIAIGLEVERFALVPQTAVDIAAKAKPVMVRQPQHLVCEIADSAIVVKLSDGQFPPYEQVIPRAYERLAEVGRQSFLTAIERVKLAASEKTYGCKLAFSLGRLTLSASNLDSGKSHSESLPTELYLQSDAFEVGINAQYLADAVSAMSGDAIRIGTNGALDPIGLCSMDDNGVNVTMPQRM